MKSKLSAAVASSLKLIDGWKLTRKLSDRAGLAVAELKPSCPIKPQTVVISVKINRLIDPGGQVRIVGGVAPTKIGRAEAVTSLLSQVGPMIAASQPVHSVKTARALDAPSSASASAAQPQIANVGAYA